MTFLGNFRAYIGEESYPPLPTATVVPNGGYSTIVPAPWFETVDTWGPLAQACR
jgi:hypothetical protein